MYRDENGQFRSVPDGIDPLFRPEGVDPATLPFVLPPPRWTTSSTLPPMDEDVAKKAQELHKARKKFKAEQAARKAIEAEKLRDADGSEKKRKAQEKRVEAKQKAREKRAVMAQARKEFAIPPERESRRIRGKAAEVVEPSAATEQATVTKPRNIAAKPELLAHTEEAEEGELEDEFPGFPSASLVPPPHLSGQDVCLFYPNNPLGAMLDRFIRSQWSSEQIYNCCSTQVQSMIAQRVSDPKAYFVARLENWRMGKV